MHKLVQDSTTSKAMLEFKICSSKTLSSGAEEPCPVSPLWVSETYSLVCQELSGCFGTLLTWGWRVVLLQNLWDNYKASTSSFQIWRITCPPQTTWSRCMYAPSNGVYSRFKGKSIYLKGGFPCWPGWLFSGILYQPLFALTLALCPRLCLRFLCATQWFCKTIIGRPT